MADSLPNNVLTAVSALARKERDADDEQRAQRFHQRRDTLLAEHGYSSRIREDDAGVTLVCYPRAWVSGGAVDRDRIDDLEAAVEVPIEGAGDPDDWDEIAAANRDIAEAVAAEHGPVHGANARAFAAFMSNHRARNVATATDQDRTEFREEYYVRNVWPTADERAVVDRSLELVQEIAQERDD